MLEKVAITALKDAERVEREATMATPQGRHLHEV